MSTRNVDKNVETRNEKGRSWRRARILNAWVDSLTVDDVLDLLDEGVLFTINPEHLYQLQRNPEFAEAYRDATYVSCDSRYVHLALKLMDRAVEHRASGSDIVPAYCRKHANDPDVTIFLLGAKPGVAQKARERINRLAGREIVVGAHGPSFGFLDNEAECSEAIEMINRSGATCLIVGLGAPKQEIWIHRHRARMPGVKVLMGVGATIDYEAEAVTRAPAWMRHNGLEWVYRVMTEPRRYALRYVRNTEFLWLALLDRFGFYRPPAPQKAGADGR
ncbi:WecB/TagA/CpsF family glycosyltransferase [Sphingomonas agri]|uniref:WecB/TagA/CpsF family glycosyltransferase n=1 Tax=Sphingomonas agri TaxID=1813878 RepID=UPI0031204C71